MRKRITSVLLAIGLLTGSIQAQVLTPSAEDTYYLIHSSSNVLAENSENRAIIESYSGTENQQIQFLSAGDGYYNIKPVNEDKYLSLDGKWNTFFKTDSSSDNAKYAIEQVSSTFVKLKCKANSKFLGSDETTSGSYLYSDKDGSDSKHYWYISKTMQEIPIDTIKTIINPNEAFDNQFEGWGVSLCWWANMCGNWSDEKIDSIVDWLVSPEHLNFNIFRYNIGGGDDPLNRNCTEHHMASGKGLRAEMEGFKDSTNSDYIWTRDAAQRKIMLKIKEKRPDAIFEAFSNSAPYYMTYSGCVAGNTNASEDNLKPEYYEEFAHYLVDVCKFYKDSFDIDFKTLEPFNEPVTNYWGANGGQEGCHFSTSAQIDFLKVLSPVLKASGLNTIISASDETSVSQSVTDFKAYIEDDSVFNLIGQWNAHTYSVSDIARGNLRALSTNYDIPLWMSEVGASGSGISGNLNMAQKLISDIRYLRPEAWLDWQYIEENNDQWCLVQGDFENETYERVKNFFVRKQFSHYIPQNSQFIYVPNDGVLAALTPDKDSLILVMLNKSSLELVKEIDLSLFEGVDDAITATRTSENENNEEVYDFSLSEDTVLTVKLPEYSITTLVVPIDRISIKAQEIKTNIPYLIVSRISSLVIAPDNSSVQINNYQQGDSSQIWMFTESGNGYVIKNLKGQMFTDNNSYDLGLSSTSAEGQEFSIDNIGDNCYKIISQRTNKSLDLEGQDNTAGANVGLWLYGTSPDVSHRQWILLEINLKGSEVSGITDQKDNESGTHIIGSREQIIVLHNVATPASVRIYNTRGILIKQKRTSDTVTQIAINPGIYIVQCILKNGEETTAKVFVK